MPSLEVGASSKAVSLGLPTSEPSSNWPGGQTGLVHISEVADTYVRDVKDYLKEMIL